MMETKKGMMNLFIQEAIKTMSPDSDQKPVNVPTNSESRNSEALKFTNGDYIKWFSELSNKNVDVAGGKGASLSEMYNNKFPVPPGFVITAQAFAYFIDKAGLKEKIKQIIESIDMENTEDLHNFSKEIRKLIEDQEFPKELKEEIIEAYHLLSSEKIDEQKISEDALNILRTAHEPIFVSVRSSATTEDLSTASFAGQQESFLNIKGDSQLILHVRKCFSSLYTPRAIYYRNKKGFKEGESLLAVVIQKMVDSEKSGVAFSRDPIKMNEDIAIEAVFGLGEGIVSGKINPDYYLVSRDLKVKNVKIADKKIAMVRTGSGQNEIVRLSPEKSRSQVLTSGEILEISNYAIKLEDHYKKPQDIEFAIEEGKMYIVQSRPITTLEEKSGEQKEKTLSGNIVVEGLGSSPGIGVGVVRIIKDLENLSKIKKGEVLVTKMTNPDMVVAMQKSTAIVTDEGGMTAHASIVSREMGIPAVVGTGDATSVLKDGMKITVDGNNGKVYEGEVAESEQAEIKQAVPTSRIKMKLILDLPDFAERAAESGIDSIGLVRLEGIIASQKKHPLLYEKEDKLEDYTKLLEEGIKRIAEHFISVWIRASDIRTDEYSSLEGAPEREINPMLGFHGVRFSLKHPKILEAELQAISNVAKEFPDKKIGIMFPQVISIEEVKEAKQYFNKIKTENMEFGVMVETPASVQIIEDICAEVDFVSFGTNDLTQYTLAVDRGEDEVQYLYNDLHPSILSQIKRVIGACKRNQVEVSICGQAGSKKEMVEFLYKKGIDSISVNADAAYEISNLIKQLEDQWEVERAAKEQEKEAQRRAKEEEKARRVEQERAAREEKEAQKREEKESARREQERERAEREQESREESEKGLYQDKRGALLPEPSEESQEPARMEDYKKRQEEQAEQGFLDKSKIQIPAEVHETIQETEKYEENIGPIEPLDSLEHVENRSEDIHEKVEKENIEKLQEYKESEESIETEGRETSEKEKEIEGLKEDVKEAEKEIESAEIEEKEDFGGSSGGPKPEDIGVYRPEEKKEPEKQVYKYNFDDEYNEF